MNDILKIAAIIVVLFAGYKVFYKKESLFGGDTKTSQRGKPPAHVSKLDVIAAKQAYDKALKKQKELEAHGAKDEHSRVLIGKATAETAAKQAYFNEAMANYQKAGGGQIVFKK